MEEDIKKAADVLINGGIILYPTDTIWGIGCMADKPEAIERVFRLKKRSETKSLIALVADERQLLRVVKNPPELSWQLIEFSEKPITIVYDNVSDIAREALSEDGSMGIRIVRDDFCRKLLQMIKKPIISSSANISGETSPLCFANISSEIKNGVDYICLHKQGEKQTKAKASTIIKISNDNTISIIRS